MVSQTPGDQDRLLQIAGAAATRLVADLNLACKHTEEWTNESLTDVLVADALARSLRSLTTTDCWGEASRLPSNEFWRIAGLFLDTGVLQRHARLKPRGYAGDFELLHRINTHYCCDHPLGRAFDRFFQRQAAPQAVRYRARQTAAALVSHCLEAGDVDYHVVSVGSGPAADVCQAVATLPEKRRSHVRATLLDLDPAALEFSQRQITPLLQPEKVRCVRENLFRLPQKRNVEMLVGKPDFLICSGLFDYLDDNAAVAMIRLFWQSLATNGTLWVWNFAPHNPSRAYMEWVGNWYLTYRTGDALERLADASDIPRDKYYVGSDDTGVDMFLTARK